MIIKPLKKMRKDLMKGKYSEVVKLKIIPLKQMTLCLGVVANNGVER